jgi:hypothetical protein
MNLWHLGLCLIAASAVAGAGQVEWKHLSSKTGDLPAPGNSTQQTASLILDVDKDGVNDFVIAARQKAPSLVWFRRTKTGWTRYVIDKDLLPLEAGGTCADIDGDGDLDIVMADDYSGNRVYWWENPCPDFDPNVPWTRRLIKDSGGKKHHDQLFGDFDGDGKPELVFWNQGAKTLFLAKIPPDPKAPQPWQLTPIYTYQTGEHEGLAACDLDGDGKIELTGAGRYFKHEGGTKFSTHVIDASQHFTRVAAGRLLAKSEWAQVLFAPGESRGRLLWYEWDGGKQWLPHDPLGHDVVNCHSLALADTNGDGHLDIFCGEMHTPGHGADATLWAFYGDGKGGFAPQVISKGICSHESKVADLDGDGRLDILAKPYTWDTPRIDVWLNQGIRNR